MPLLNVANLRRSCDQERSDSPQLEELEPNVCNSIAIGATSTSAGDSHTFYITGSERAVLTRRVGVRLGAIAMPIAEKKPLN